MHTWITVAALFLFAVATWILLWILKRYEPPKVALRRIEADLGLIDEAIPSAEAYSLRLLNDDRTPMDFVVEALQATLDLSREHALHLMLKVHQHGKADVGRMSFEKARGFADAILAMSQAGKHPLRCEVVRSESPSDNA